MKQHSGAIVSIFGGFDKYISSWGLQKFPSEGNVMGVVFETPQAFIQGIANAWEPYVVELFWGGS